jgi:hypothetical protein
LQIVLNNNRRFGFGEVSLVQGSDFINQQTGALFGQVFLKIEIKTPNSGPV